MKTTGSRVLGRTASLARIVWRTPSISQQDQLPGLEIDEIDAFDEPFAIFWHRVQHRFPIMVVRDPAYLNWRFKGLATREYKVLEARSEGKIRAYIAMRVAALGRLSAGLIVDLMVETSGEGRAAGRLLIDRATAYFREQDLDLVAALALRHTDEFRLLRARGFWVSPRFLEPQSFRMVVRAHEEEASPSHLAYRLRNWYLTLGDYEAF
jgi:N-acetylglutamate synthase-like GNAT family acetyltransferase